MKKPLIVIISAIVLIVLIITVVSVLGFVVGGDEDTWICSNGTWVKQGNPKEPMPTQPCSSETNQIAGKIPCELITSSTDCRERKDCLSVDLCDCMTDYQREILCLGEAEPGCLCDMGGFSYCTTLDCADSSDDSARYYTNLRTLCTDDCCRSSLDAMQLNKYQLEPTAGCSSYQQQNSLKCLNSYSWCEPKQNVNSQTNSASVPITKAECRAQGGLWGYYGRQDQCNLPTSDKGKACSDGSECEAGICPVVLTADELSQYSLGQPVPKQGICPEYRVGLSCIHYLTSGVLRMACFD